MENEIKQKIELKNFTLLELEIFFEEQGYPKFRARQLFNWIYNNLCTDFNSMQNLSKDLRNMLSEKFSLKTLAVIEVANSENSETKKILFETKDKNKIETVLIPEKERSTLCISTQVGCPLDCKFCATGLLGFTRNLSVGEIIDQYLLSAKRFGKEYITNIVYMGMGEPLLNFNGTIGSLKILTEEFNKSISRTRITVSTSGIPKGIKELAESGLRVKLALSLHSPFEEVRNKIMPINKRFTLAETIEAVKYYSKITKTRITFEYTMLKGINDREEDIKKLTKLVKSLPAKINIIPFNSIKHIVDGGFSAELEPTSNKNIEDFANKLRNNNITVLVRSTQGNDIAAACGQLAGKYERSL